MIKAMKLKRKSYKIYNDKVENILPTLKTNSIDLIVADPPFNLKKQYDGYKDNMKKKDYLIWVEEWIYQGFRLLKPSGSFWIYCPTNLLGAFQLIGSKYGIWQNTIVWKYANPISNRKRFPKTWSAWLFFSKTEDFNFYYEFFETIDSLHSHRKHYEKPIYDVWEDIPKLVGGYLAQYEVVLKGGKNYERMFVYQLPVVLLKRIVGVCTKENDVVLDLFAHSGACSVASKIMNRRSIIVEQSLLYCDEIKRRLQRYDRAFF